jgi:putative methyltransferase (TIGR04325 family)
MGLISSLKRRLFRPSEVLEGYEQTELVDVIFRKTIAYQPQGEWPEMRGVSSVLDFGGGCGLHYKQARSPSVRWAVVETPAMVERAKELATDRLQFFPSISDAKNWLGPIDVMHSNGAIQYAPNPQFTLSHLCALNAKQMLWNRVLLGEPETEIQESLLGDNGPGPIEVKEKIVRYARTRISETDFISAHAGYKIAKRGPDWFQFTIHNAPSPG